MPFSPEEIRRNRDYFAGKLRTEKSRASVLKAVEGNASYDFVLLDTRGRDAFAAGHIPGSWCADDGDVSELASQLPQDKEIVTYCWSHD